MPTPEQLALAAQRMRREARGMDRGTADWLRRRVVLSDGVYVLAAEEVDAALRSGIFEVDVDASRLWWHDRG